MNPITNLLPGSKFKAWIYDEKQSVPKEIIVFVATDNSLYRDDTSSGDMNCKITWEQIAEAPREAVTAQIHFLEGQISGLQNQKYALERQRTRDYPVNLRFSVEEFKEKFPNLHLSMRCEDYTEFQLEQYDRQAYWKMHRYDEPG